MHDPIKTGLIKNPLMEGRLISENKITKEEKIEFHYQVCDIEKAVLEMNGPYLQTSHILRLLSTLREAWLDDEIFGQCEQCREIILESESETAIYNEDGCWFCASCVADQHA